MSATDPLAVLAQVVGDRPAWLVGGAVRDRLMNRLSTDFDVVVDGDPEPLARAVGRGAGGHAFALSPAFGAWRVVARDHRWQLDVLALNGATLAEDLSRRDLTINAIAQPLAGDGGLVDPFGGLSDLEARRLAMISPQSFCADPLRVLRLVRLAAQLGFDIAARTADHARCSVADLDGVAPERVFAELRSLLTGARPLEGLALMDELGVTRLVLPELAALDGVTQSEYHHLDVAGHTRAVLAETIELVDDPTRLGIDDSLAAELTAALAQPLANELTRGQALRFGALLHDVAKSRTRGVTGEGRVTFMGHDALGAEMAGEILHRLRASDRLSEHLAALTRHHLVLGFLVHRMPLSRRDLYDYLITCAPVGVDVTVLSVADRLATRGRDAPRAIARHCELAREMLGETLAYERRPPRPPLRGDELAAALGIAPGPQIGPLLAELTAATFAGEVRDREQALTLARSLVDVERPPSL
jgi:poly(A) polymerase